MRQFCSFIVSLIMIVSCSLQKPGDLREKSKSYNDSKTTDDTDSMIKISTSVFIMGEPGFETSKTSAERPVKLTVSAFYFAKTEVLQSEWMKVMHVNPSLVINMKIPVDNVSWYDAIAYCNRRSIMEGMKPCYSLDGECNPDYWGDIPSANDSRWNNVVCNFEAGGYRLPTEAEWELAYRLHVPGKDIDTDNNSSGWPYQSKEEDASEVRTTPQAINLAISGGVFELNTNVWEWCNDWYKPYPKQAKKDYAGAATGDKRSLRGGRCQYENFRIPAAYRSRYAPSQRGSEIGFRVVRR